MIQWIHSELLAWGHWAARQDDGRGYPSQSPFARLTPPASGWADTDLWSRIPDDLKRVHVCMGMIEPPAFKVTVSHLYKHGYNLRRTAAVMHVDHKTVAYRRDRVHEMLCGCLAREAA